MGEIRITPMPTGFAETLWAGGSDHYGMHPERHIADGDGVPCRHCLSLVTAGEPYLTLAYRPFPEKQPYAETGPVFLHEEPCSPYQEPHRLPFDYLGPEPKILRGYDRKSRIVYGTGRVIAPSEIETLAQSLLQRDDIAFVDVRSAQNNCFALRLERSETGEV